VLYDGTNESHCEKITAFSFNGKINANVQTHTTEGKTKKIVILDLILPKETNKARKPDTH